MMVEIAFHEIEKMRQKSNYPIKMFPIQQTQPSNNSNYKLLQTTFTQTCSTKEQHTCRTERDPSRQTRIKHRSKEKAR